MGHSDATPELERRASVSACTRYARARSEWGLATQVVRATLECQCVGFEAGTPRFTDIFHT